MSTAHSFTRVPPQSTELSRLDTITFPWSPRFIIIQPASPSQMVYRSFQLRANTSYVTSAHSTHSVTYQYQYIHPIPRPSSDTIRNFEWMDGSDGLSSYFHYTTANESGQFSWNVLQSAKHLRTIYNYKVDIMKMTMTNKIDLSSFSFISISDAFKRNLFSKCFCSVCVCAMRPYRFLLIGGGGLGGGRESEKMKRRPEWDGFTDDGGWLVPI